MAITRTQAKKIKFTDEDDDDVIEITQPVLEPVVVISSSSAEEEREDEEESESDDEAPEEESTSKSKQAILDTEKQKREQLVKEKAAQREKRRELDSRYAAQQQQRKAEQEEKERQQHQEQQKYQEIPDYLPDDILEDITSGILQQNQEESNTVKKGKHIRLDLEEDKKLKLITKLKEIKQRKSMAIEKAKGVFVKVQLNQNKVGKVVPKAEKKIVGSRDKWLKRKSLNRK